MRRKRYLTGEEAMALQGIWPSTYLGDAFKAMQQTVQGPDALHCAGNAFSTTVALAAWLSSLCTTSAWYTVAQRNKIVNPVTISTASSDNDSSLARASKMRKLESASSLSSGSKRPVEDSDPQQPPKCQKLSSDERTEQVDKPEDDHPIMDDLENAIKEHLMRMEREDEASFRKRRRPILEALFHGEGRDRPEVPEERPEPSMETSAGGIGGQRRAPGGAPAREMVPKELSPEFRLPDRHPPEDPERNGKYRGCNKRGESISIAKKMDAILKYEQLVQEHGQKLGTKEFYKLKLPGAVSSRATFL